MADNSIVDYNSYNRNVYILGTAEFGKTNIPILIESESKLKAIYGTKGTIVQGFLQAKSGSLNNNVYAVKINGSHSTVRLNANIKKRGIVNDGVIFKSKYSNEIYNNLKIILTETSIIFVFPKELGGSYKEYIYADYEIFGLLMKKINGDTDNNRNMVYMQCSIEPSSPLENSLLPVNDESVYMSGGYSGLITCKDNSYYNLENTYSLLEGENIDIITPLGVCIDDIDPSNLASAISSDSIFYPEGRDYLKLKYEDGRAASYYEQLVVFCAKQLNSGIVTSGVIGFNNTNDRYIDGVTSEYINKVIAPNLNANKTNISMRSYHQLVSVVAGDLQYNFGDIVVNGSVIYAGLLGNLNSSVNSTNQPFESSILLYNEFNEEVMNALADIGIVTFRHSVLKDRVVVSNGVTSVATKSDMHYYCNVRMVQMTITAISDLVNSYMGEDVDNIIDNKIINEDIDDLILSLITGNIIDKCLYEIVKNEQDNTVIVYLDLKTRYMIESIRKSINIDYNT